MGQVFNIVVTLDLLSVNLKKEKKIDSDEFETLELRNTFVLIVAESLATSNVWGQVHPGEFKIEAKIMVTIVVLINIKRFKMHTILTFNKINTRRKL